MASTTRRGTCVPPGPSRNAAGGPLTFRSRAGAVSVMGTAFILLTFYHADELIALCLRFSCRPSGTRSEAIVNRTTANAVVKTWKCLFAIVVCSCLSAGSEAAKSAASGPGSRPEPPGKLVDLGGHKLHVNCTGKGSPIVVVENGFGDFSFDWIPVQNRVAPFTRVCTNDRAGYAWSDRGPQPRTFAQINLELHDA